MELEERKLYVEVALLEERNGNHGYRSILQEIAVEFARRLPISSFATSINYLTRGPYPGVYLIYYVGETSLYRTLVNGSRDRPIYIGMSETDILDRLKDHRKKVEDAKDLELRNFAVRFLIVDIKYYAPAIEGALIEFYNPLWNDKKVKFNFGNANKNNNNWKKYHVIQNESTIAEMIKLVRDNHQGS